MVVTTSNAINKAVRHRRRVSLIRESPLKLINKNMARAGNGTKALVNSAVFNKLLFSDQLFFVYQSKHPPAINVGILKRRGKINAHIFPLSPMIYPFTASSWRRPNSGTNIVIRNTTIIKLPRVTTHPFIVVSPPGDPELLVCHGHFS
jgi:hypothetical protein